MSHPPARASFAMLLRHWRTLRGLSQLALAGQAETTTRHLSYLENGRSRPGRELVLRIAGALDVPLRSRNELLVAAGLAPEFPSHELGSSALEPYRRAIRQVIEAMRPFPAFVVNPWFELIEANDVGRRMLPGVGSDARVNLMEAFLAPGPARELVQNFAEVAWSWHDRLVRGTATTATPEALALRERVSGYLRGVPRPFPDASGEAVVCPTFRVDGVTVRTIGMTMRFGPSRDVTLEELSVDVLCPRDGEAQRFFERLAGMTDAS